MPLDKITAVDVQNWQLSLAEKFNPNYIRIIQGSLSIAFDRAVILGLIEKNPSRMIGHLKSKKQKWIFGHLKNFKKLFLCFTRVISMNTICLFAFGYYL